MFEQKSLNKIDGDYFNIIIADSQDVTIQSRNTGHYWYLHCSGNPTEEALVIFHKHRFKDGYHQHGHARSLRQTVVVQHIITAGTIDEDVMKALANKDMTQNRLIAAVKARVTHGR